MQEGVTVLVTPSFQYGLKKPGMPNFTAKVALAGQNFYAAISTSKTSKKMLKQPAPSGLISLAGTRTTQPDQGRRNLRSCSSLTSNRRMHIL